MSSRVYYDSSFEQNEVSKNIAGRKKSLSLLQDGALLSKLTKRRQKRSSSKDGNKWTRVETNKIRQYTNNREMCETIFSSQTRQNVHISTPSPPCPFQREYNGSLKNRKDGIVFFRFSRWSRIVCSFVYLCCRQFFFCFRGCFSPNVIILYSGTGERGSYWETFRGASKEVMNPVLCIPTISNF